VRISGGIRGTILKVEQSYEIANILLTVETAECGSHFVLVKRGGKSLVMIYHGDDLRGATNQFGMLQHLIPALIRN